MRCEKWDMLISWKGLSPFAAKGILQPSIIPCYSESCLLWREKTPIFWDLDISRLCNCNIPIHTKLLNYSICICYWNLRNSDFSGHRNYHSNQPWPFCKGDISYCWTLLKCWFCDAVSLLSYQNRGKSGRLI